MIPEHDLEFLREAASDLRDYILSKEIFWPLHTRNRVAGGGQLPQLTLGNLALSQVRLSACQLSDEQSKDYQNSNLLIQKVRDEWLSNWQQKEEREFGMRLNLWRQYLSDLQSDRRGHFVFYTREVRTRVILQLLQSMGRGSQVNHDLLRMLDKVLQGLSHPGPFLWEEQIKAGFPHDPFWFLYITINN